MPTCQNCSNPVGAIDKFCPYCDSPTEVAFSSMTDSGSKVQAASGQISALIKRYRDASPLARVVDGVGSLSKGIGIVMAGVLVLVGLMMVGGDLAGDATKEIDQTVCNDRSILRRI